MRAMKKIAVMEKYDATGTARRYAVRSGDMLIWSLARWRCRAQHERSRNRMQELLCG
jgi:hypothetical protein